MRIYEMLVHDSETNDMRRKDFNQALFDEDTGRQKFQDTDLDMVMEKVIKGLDKAYEDSENMSYTNARGDKE